MRQPLNEKSRLQGMLAEWDPGVCFLNRHSRIPHPGRIPSHNFSVFLHLAKAEYTCTTQAYFQMRSRFVQQSGKKAALYAQKKWPFTIPRTWQSLVKQMTFSTQEGKLGNWGIQTLNSVHVYLCGLKEQKKGWLCGISKSKLQPLIWQEKLETGIREHKSSEESLVLQIVGNTGTLGPATQAPLDRARSTPQTGGFLKIFQLKK